MMGLAPKILPGADKVYLVLKMISDMLKTQDLWREKYDCFLNVDTKTTQPRAHVYSIQLFFYTQNFGSSFGSYSTGC